MTDPELASPPVRDPPPLGGAAPPPVSLQEAALGRLAAGDADGAATLVLQALGPAVLRYLRATLRNEEDAADALAQWSENVWRGLPGFRGDAALKTWCYRLAWHAALNLRSEAWRHRVERLAPGQASRLALSIRSESGPAPSLERHARALDELREALGEEDRSILILRIDQGLSWGEVAEVMAWEGRPVEPAALMKRFGRIKGRLCRLARERGLLPGSS